MFNKPDKLNIIISLGKINVCWRKKIFKLFYEVVKQNQVLICLSKQSR